MAESTMQGTIDLYRTEFPGWPNLKPAQYIDALNLTKFRAQRVRDAMEDRINFAQVGIFNRDQCEQGIEALDGLISRIDNYFLPHAQQAAQNEPDKVLRLAWHDAKVVTNYPMVDPDTGETTYFTPEYLAPDYFGFACAEEDATLREALAELPDDIASSAKRIGLGLGAGAVVAAGIGLGVFLMSKTK